MATLHLLTALGKALSVHISVGVAGHGLGSVLSLLSVLQHRSRLCISSTLPSATFNFCGESNESQLWTANLYAYHSKSPSFVFFFNTFHPRKCTKCTTYSHTLVSDVSSKVVLTKC